MRMCHRNEIATAKYFKVHKIMFNKTESSAHKIINHEFFTAVKNVCLKLFPCVVAQMIDDPFSLTRFKSHQKVFVIF